MGVPIRMRQVLELEEDESSVSQLLIEAALVGEEATVNDALAHKLVDVNYRGTVSLRVKYSDTVQQEEAPDQVKIEYEEFKTDVTPLFAAAHAGHINITRKLLKAGADVNQKVFRGYATTAAAREGHYMILNLLQRAGAQQLALEDALLEACLFGQGKSVELLISSDMTRPEVLAQALLYASSRGFMDIVAILIKSGVDVNSWHRVLLRSAKPALHANVNCTPLIAAIVARQDLVDKYLLKPYNEAWCAIEYWDSKGSILRMLLEYLSPNDQYNGRTLIFHAILCQNTVATKLLLAAGADAEHCIPTRDGHEFRPLRLAARLGCLAILKLLVAHGCKLNAQTHSGNTALMLCAKVGFQDCFKYLLIAGADVGLLNQQGQSVMSITYVCGSGSSIHDIMWEALKAGHTIYSSNPEVFNSVHFVARLGDVKTLQSLLKQGVGLLINVQDKLGYSPAMIAAKEGHIEAFKLLVYAGADVGLKNCQNETALSVAKSIETRDSLERILVEAIMADLEVLMQLIKHGSDINAQDDDDYTPLMLAAKEGHDEACRLLLLAGADTSISTSQGETALTLAKQAASSKTEKVIMDHLAKKFVLRGSLLLKHTRQGKGTPHMKTVRMLKCGVLSWGDSSKRNVMCCDTALGPSPRFQRNHKKGDATSPGTFRIITNTGREVHFESSTAANAELWVRGIKLIILEVSIQATLKMNSH
ncbi:hypothetical protein CY35_06G026300 [Sphagnum magellanicum]|nr:hypothetical protein CY35_06G026300 [Sphagnum magellanicum]